LLFFQDVGDRFTLTRRQRPWGEILDELQSGRSPDPNDFLNRAVNDYVLAGDLGEECAPEEIDTMIAEGLDDIARGDTIEGEEAFRQLRPIVLNAADKARETIRGLSEGVQRP
jgi:hypothetical protein